MLVNLNDHLPFDWVNETGFSKNGSSFLSCTALPYEEYHITLLIPRYFI